MARLIRNPRRRAVPEVPFYAGELPATEVRTTTTVVEDVEVDESKQLLWLLVIPVAILLALSAYLIGKDDAPREVAPSPSPAPVTTSVLVVPGQAPPPVIVNQPPVIVVTQQPAPTPSPTTS